MKNIVFVFLCGLGLCSAGCRQPQSSPAGSPSPVKQMMVTLDSATAGSIAGTISFQGPAIKLPAIDMTADPACPQKPQASDAIAIDHGKLANVFVYVKEGLPPGNYGIPTEPVVLDQKGCRYQPHMLGMVAGQPLQILNSDNADHNVHAMPVSNQPWNESQAAKDPAITKTFAKPEMMVAVQCNQHPWMRAYINVMANSYFAVSGADGKFEIRNLPPGQYTITAVHEKFGEQAARVIVASRQTAKADFTFHPAE